MTGLDFKVKDIEDGAILTENIVCTTEDINLEVENVSFKGPIHISVRLFREGTEVYVTGDMENEAEVDCGKCLEMFTTEFNSHFDVQYYQTSDSEKFGWMDESAGIRYYGEEHIDISDDVRQAIIAEIPLWARCSEDCKGLCHKCGQNLNLGDCDCSRLLSDTSPFAVLANLLPQKQVVEKR